MLYYYYYFFVFSESLMQCQFTDEEWRYLNDIYNENDAVDGNIVHNDSDIVIFDRMNVLRFHLLTLFKILIAQ
ncbi:hypothetical protein B5X24_HaOG214064 [Helicoverpa armigera]|uniref:Uncharacterized protein n=1 Tax=Helicoverpa armigera TaxID=29058 RepID=A0A2W1B7V5_HELAM|nr:hypothetical protein B5X24_HaOG214064 [Helicoverpa armigera]